LEFSLRTTSSHLLLDKGLKDRIAPRGSGYRPLDLLSLNPGFPQGCVLSPQLYTLYTPDCIPAHSSNAIIKLAEDITVVGCILKENESEYRETRWSGCLCGV